MAQQNELFVPYDDGLKILDVGSWAETKYKVVSLYTTLFSSGMKAKWGQRVYIDLYAGAGFSRIRDSDKLLAGSPILALTVPDRFDKYIFCENDSDSFEALKARATRIAPTADISFVPGDCQEKISEIRSLIPKASSGHTVLSLCFVDPFDIGLHFSTIQALSDMFIDFLVLLAVHMDAGRAYALYLDEDNTKVDNFLGSRDWRKRWRETEERRFPEFLAMEFAQRMELLGYRSTPLHLMKKVRADDNNRPLYFLALFSRHQRAYQFWEQVLKYETEQTKLPF